MADNNKDIENETDVEKLKGIVEAGKARLDDLAKSKPSIGSWVTLHYERPNVLAKYSDGQKYHVFNADENSLSIMINGNHTRIRREMATVVDTPKE